MMMHYRDTLLVGLAALVLAGCDRELLVPEPSAPFVTISAGVEHSCGVDDRGDAYCWGAGRQGQLGNNVLKNQDRPVRVDGSRTWAVISAGAAHTCGVTSRGEALCWGWNALGQLGIGEPIGLGSPATVAGAHEWRTVSSGWYHACGVTAGGEAYCWGHNRQGQLGTGGRGEAEHSPVAVAGGIEWEMVSGGAHHSCGVAVDGTAYCWGLNQYGQLGESEEPLSTVPVVAWPHLKFRTISAGVGHTCGVAEDGKAYCWGKNEDGELGNASIDPGGLYRRGRPVAVYGGLAFRSISAGNAVSCGVTTGDVAYCWGWGLYGQLGLGSTVGHSTPQRVGRGQNFTEVSAGGGTHVCGVTPSRAAFCWGTGERGQLGSGTARALDPMRVDAG